MDLNFLSWFFYQKLWIYRNQKLWRKKVRFICMIMMLSWCWMLIVKHYPPSPSQPFPLLVLKRGHCLPPPTPSFAKPGRKRKRRKKHRKYISKQYTHMKYNEVRKKFAIIDPPPPTPSMHPCTGLHSPPKKTLQLFMRIGGRVLGVGVSNKTIKIRKKWGHSK